MTADRAVLACPHCGAPLPRATADAAATCRFCGVTSLPVAVSATHAPEAHGPPCPRCDAPLFEGRAADATLLGCGRCGGVWLDNASAKRVLATKSAAVVELASRADARALATSVPRRTHARCPVCQEALTTTTDQGSRVELDVCVAHGTFFDRYELGLVLRAWGRSPVELTARAPTPTTIPDFRRSDWDVGDAVPGALVAGGAFVIVGALLGLASDT